VCVCVCVCVWVCAHLQPLQHQNQLQLQLFKCQWFLIEATNRMLWPTERRVANKSRPSVGHVVNMMNASKKCHLLRSSNTLSERDWAEGMVGTLCSSSK